jgi:hypothetical protein
MFWEGLNLYCGEKQMGFLTELFRRNRTGSVIHYEKRREPRHTSEIHTDLLDASGRRWSCKIVDMSQCGFGISTRAGLSIGSYVSIIKPYIPAEVLWSKGNNAGLKIIK